MLLKQDTYPRHLLFILEYFIIGYLGFIFKIKEMDTPGCQRADWDNVINVRKFVRVPNILREGWEGTSLGYGYLVLS